MEEQRPKRISRTELYARVWQTPMIRLGLELGISGNGLAKICQRLDVPYPPRGYWAKKEAGKPVSVTELPQLQPGTPTDVDVYPSPPQPQEPAPIQAVIAAAEASASAVTIPETLEGAHPKVKAWLAQHKEQQAEREREHKRRRRDEWSWAKPLLADLTERDLYRFRVTSALLKAVEAAGGRVESAIITGKVTFLIAGQKIECSIVEKMRQSLLVPREEGTKWTAYPGFHQNGLTSSGFLRVTITTYLRGGVKEWVETSTKRMGAFLPEIVGRIMAAGPILIEWERERKEEARKREEEEQRRQERRRLKHRDEHRWRQFCAFATDWHERSRLLAFLAEIENRSHVEAEATIAEQQLSEWIAWAQQKIDSLDPFQEGVAGLFEKISASIPPAHPDWMDAR
jgi:hypothetical protein